MKTATETTAPLHERIAPHIKPSYSPNLHAFVRLWTRERRREPGIWLSQDGETWIGEQDDEFTEQDHCGFTGLRLARVLVKGVRAFRERMWYPNMGQANMALAADFWDRYQAIGRCVIDTEHRTHFINSDGRYVMAGDVRTCTWCGAQHQRVIRTRTTQYDDFVPIEARG